MKNVLLVHGFNGTPDIFDYFKNELEKKEYNIIIPKFPTREKITVEGYFDIFDKYKNIFNKDLIVIAHSMGNPMLIKYISKNKLHMGLYISLAGFSKDYYNEGKDILNEKLKLTILNNEELTDAVNLINKRYSIFSKDDHLVPYEILNNFSKEIKSNPISIDNIGHMGRKSGLKELPEVIDIILNNN